ncbi:MAG: DUF4365 and DUF1817 domain-containing protein [Desulfobacter postgatei]|uniref:DUF4365 and DUF1817 domain-containing protein n=1 Tax=Desulfobacter postgatei TaxID=2293 RepID=UPI0023F38A8C|nr:DUF4365 and DUF1817 domain-containing protein [Desulfobacter postgatei]MDD4274940.1 DUF4365 and DUF1817 domain-containing protein [Desulfobacter postgatei]
MNQGFPTYSNSARKGDKGVELVSRVVNDKFNWLFKRNHQEHDFGIDAQADIILDDGSVTGQMLAFQIKFGSSFFNEENEWGYVYRGEQKHFNYLSNYPTPVLIVICHPQTNICYWVQFEPEATSKAGKNWKITIPFENEFHRSKDTISSILPPPADYLSEVESYWMMNDIITINQHFLCIIGRDQVEAFDVSDVRSFFNRIRSTRELAAHCQGKIELSFHGYDNDPRELYEVPEVRAFVPILSEALPELFFFAYTGDRCQGLKTIAMCLTEIKKLSDAPNAQNQIQVEVSTANMAFFLQRHWPGLNEMTEWLKMPIEKNKEISFNIIRAMGFEPPP